MLNAIRGFFVGKNFMRSLLAFIIVVTGIAYIYFITFHIIPEQNKDVANLCLGYVVGLISGVTLYYFGTSQGSSEKDESIKNMVPAPTSSTSVTVTKSEANNEQKP